MIADYLKSNSCYITCGGQHGTGFLVSSRRIITATHIFASYLEQGTLPTITAKFYFPTGPVMYTVSLEGKGLNPSPIAVLSVDEDVPISSPPLLLSREPELSESAVAFGFPAFAPDGYFVKLTVNNCFPYIRENLDVNIVLDYNGKPRNLMGLSGAALFIEDMLAGTIFTQSSDRGETLLVSALGGLKFREELDACGISLDVDNPHPLHSGEETHQILTLRRENNQLISEVNRSISRDLDRIMDISLCGQQSAAWGELMRCIDRLESGKSTTAIASYYLLAAVWSLGVDEEHARKYISKAITADPNIDTRLFEAEHAILNRDYKAALEILTPVDNISVSNGRARTLHLSGDNEGALDALKSCQFEFDGPSRKLLAIIYLELGQYEEAHTHIDILLDRNPNASIFLQIKAQVFYGQALQGVAAITGNQCIIFGPYSFLPDMTQQQYLSQAYDYMKKALTYVETNDEQRKWILANLLSISTVLPGKDPMRWLHNLEAEYPLNSFAILYHIACGVPFDAEEDDKFLALDNQKMDSGYYQAQYALFVYRKQYDEARNCLQQHTTAIVTSEGVPKEHLLFTLALKAKDWESAGSIAAAMTDDIEKQRMLLILGTESNRLSKKKLAKSLLAFAESTGQAIDYHNAYLSFRRRGDWESSYHAAKGWYKIKPELSVLMYQVEALTNLGRERKALLIIKRIEEAGYTSKVLLRFKARCLFGLSKLDETLDIINSIQLEEKDHELVELKAHSYLQRGLINDAIFVLKDYLNHGYKDKEVMRMLVELLKSRDLNEAYKYSLSLSQAYPDDQSLRMVACHLDALTGENQLKEDWAKLLKSSDSDNGVIQIFSTDELLSFLEQRRKDMDKINEDYAQMKTPLCFKIDQLNSCSLGLSLYYQWKEKMLGSGLAVFGGAPTDTIPDTEKTIVLDYTACITAIELGIFQAVTERWKCVISPQLLPLIYHDITLLKTVQPSVSEENLKIVEELQNATNLIIVDEQEYRGQNLYEIMLAVAGKCGYCIVSDDPISESWITLPEKWYSYRITDKDFLALLGEKGILGGVDYTTNPTHKTHALSSINETTFLLGTSMVNNLSRQGLLPLVCDSINVAILAVEFRRAQNNAQEDLSKVNAANWLHSVHTTIASAVNSDKVSIFEQQKTGIEDKTPLTSLLYQEIKYAKTHGHFLWCDDRFMIKFAVADARYINFYNILSSLYPEEGASFRHIIDQLFSCHVGNLLPNPRHLFFHLSLCKADGFGRLKESTALKNMKDTICTTSEFCLSRTQEWFLDERRVYACNLFSLIFSTIKMIWNTEAEDIDWKAACSSWIVQSFFMMCTNTESDDNGLDFSMLESQFIIYGFAIKSDNLQHYFMWLYSFLSLSWKAAPSRLNSAAKEVSDFIDGLDNKRVAYALSVISQFPSEVFTERLLQFFDKEKPCEILDNDEPAPGQPSNSFILFRIEDDILNGILSNDIVAQEDALFRIFEQPEAIGTPIVDLLDEAQNKGKLIPPDFLASLYWYVPDTLKPRVKGLYGSSIYMQMNEGRNRGEVCAMP